MNIHPWNVSAEEAYQIQDDLKKYIIIPDSLKPPITIGGVDVSYEANGKKACCAISVMSYPDLDLVCHVDTINEVAFLYIPGLLAFREGPLVEQAFSLLPVIPDILLFDGHGLCHPSGIGIASHLGFYLGIATIGCAKNHLAGSFIEPGPIRGSKSPIMIGDKLVGYVLRTKDHTRPVFVSPGHRVDTVSSADICLGCTGRFRIPEPIRHAHVLSRAVLKEDVTA